MSDKEPELITTWVPGPETRGTWQILYSCVFTIGLCVFTVLHLNIPKPGSGKWHRVWEKIKWVMIGIFAPEAVVYTAIAQFLGILQFRSDLRRIVSGRSGGGDLEETQVTTTPQASETAAPRKTRPIFRSDVTQDSLRQQAFPGEKISLTYAWYVLMGGFTVDLSPIHDSMGVTTLTPSAVIQFAELGLFLSMPETNILDKSKTDYLGKGLAICQTLFLAAQCLGRKMQGLPTTLLELHALVHVLCALIIYVCWWTKPLDIIEATRIDKNIWENPSDDMAFVWQKKLAEMLFSSREIASWMSPEGVPESDRKVLGKGYGPGWIHRDDDNVGAFRFWKITRDVVPNRNRYTSIGAPARPVAYLATEEATSGPGNIPRREHATQVRLDFSAKAMRRWQLAVKAADYPPMSDAERLYFGEGLYFVERIPDFSTGYGHTVLSFVLVAVFSAVYGGIHAAFGWQHQFPSQMEGFAWRISCVILALLGSFMVAVIRRTARRESLFEFDGMCCALWIVPSLVPIFYLLARLFLVVEAFASMRCVEAGVYTQVSWAQLIPHV